MLTPRFEIVQTDNDVTISVHAPYSDIRETEVYVEGTDFRFYSTPYYLRLKLPGKIEENDSSSGSYDSDKGDFVLRFSKVNKGEYFPRLDMITALLAPPKKKTDFVPKIEVIGNPSANEDLINECIEGDGFDAMHSLLPYHDIVSLLPESPKYGFANRITEKILGYEEGFLKEVIDIPAPNMIPQNKRRDLREKMERADFNEEHYLADLMEPDHMEPYISYTPEWYKLNKADITFTSTEVDLLKELPNREYLLTIEEVHKLLLGIVDILFGSCYNHRTTMGENTVESSWPISKLSSTLSWFDEFSSLKDVITACVRRSLIYPFFRNWKLSMKVLKDVKTILKLGKKYIIKRFCEIHHLFRNGHEPWYTLNKLYIEDYLIWLQQLSEPTLETLASAVSSVTYKSPTKEDMQLDLIELEEAAYLVAEEDLVIENTVHEVVDQMDELTINNQEKNKLSSSSDESDSESGSDSDTTTRLSSSSDESDSDSISDSDTTSSSDSDSESCSKKDNVVYDSDDTSIPDIGCNKDSKNSNCNNSNKEYFVYDSDDASIPE